MERNTPPQTERQPRRLRAVIEIIGAELKIFSLADNDRDEKEILDALRFLREEFAA